VPELRRAGDADEMTRIGTWNLAGRWSAAHRDFLLALDCDVLLLTEVRRDVELSGYGRHLCENDMARGRAWAGVLSRRSLQPLRDPHEASAMVDIDGVAYCSSILPWRGAGGRPCWPGEHHAEWTAWTTGALRRELRAPVIWGGDLNHALDGREWSGSKAGRAHIHTLVDELGLQTPTAHLPHRINGLLTIDHIAVPQTWQVLGATRHDATGLSDHDGYTVQVVC
jgi:endonuclease/exonuclease/phosphatase family metal-dependent hydrolase